MPGLDRNMFGVYIKDTPENNPPHLMGTKLFHAYHPQPFVDTDGKEMVLWFVQMSKDILDDQFSDCKETCDFSLGAMDQENIPEAIKFALLGDYPSFLEELENLPIVAKPLIQQDIADGKDFEEILESRVVLFLPQFMGFKLSDVFQSFPWLEEQARCKDENGKFITVKTSYESFDENGAPIVLEEESYQYSITPCKPLEDL